MRAAPWYALLLLLATGAVPAAAPQAHADARGWETPVRISPDEPCQYWTTSAPIIDSHGNAWVFLIGHAGFTNVVQATHSVGHTNQWTTPETAYVANSSVYPPAIVIDSHDRITLAFRDLANGGPDLLNTLRYVPGAGWSGPVTIADHGDFFQTVTAGVDAHDDVVVTYGGDDLHGVWGVVYDANADAWGAPTQLSPAGVAAHEPTTVGNRARADVYSLYALYTPQLAANAAPVYARHYDPSTRSWEAATRAPGTGHGYFGSIIPAIVDDQGILTVPYFLGIFLPSRQWLHRFRATRLEAGGWTTPVDVLPYVGNCNDVPFVYGFSDMDYDESGDLMYLFEIYLEGSERLMASHYRAATHAWDPPAQVYNDSHFVVQHLQCALRSDGSALAVHRDYDVPAFNSRFYDGSEWTDDYPVPISTGVVFVELAAAGLDVLMIYDDDVNEYATWFHEIVARSRPSAP